jgi:5'-nucleotidase
MMGFEEGSRRALWETATAHAPSLISKLIDGKWQPGTLLNVNFPDVAPEDVAGIEVTTQGVRDAGLLNIDSRSDPWGTPYFWFGFERRKSTLLPGTDLAAVAAQKISVTPLSLNLTDLDGLAALRKKIEHAPVKPKV